MAPKKSKADHPFVADIKKEISRSKPMTEGRAEAYKIQKDAVTKSQPSKK
jgi:hypothetical protein